MSKMTLSEALDAVYGRPNWDNPLYPIFSISGCNQTPYEAYCDLKPEFQRIVDRLIGHKATKKDNS